MILKVVNMKTRDDIFNEKADATHVLVFQTHKHQLLTP